MNIFAPPVEFVGMSFTVVFIIQSSGWRQEYINENYAQIWHTADLALIQTYKLAKLDLRSGEDC